MAMNLEAREELSALILDITKTGDLYLDPQQVKRVKSICKKSNINVKTAYDLILLQLKKKHAQIRYSSTQLMAELFQRSHVFRSLLVADYPVFLQLTVGIHQHTLPPPVVFAEKTKLLAISLTNEWNKQYGAVYKQIASGYDFLKHHLKVDFSNLVPVTEEARSAEQLAQEERSKRLRKNKYEKAALEIQDKAQDLQENIRKMDACFDILVPKLDDESTLDAMFDTSSQDEAEDDIEKSPNLEGDLDEAMMRYDPLGVHGNALGSTRYKLTINLPKDNPAGVSESEDNAELFVTLRECYRLIVKKHWPLVMGWLDVLMKADHEPGEQRAEYDRLLKLTIDLKKQITDAKSKCEDLGVNMDTMYGPHGDDSGEDDEEFEEVDVSAAASNKQKGKQPLRQQVPERRKASNPVFVMYGEDVLKDDPTYSGGTRVVPLRPIPAAAADGSLIEQSSSRSTSPLKNAEIPTLDGETREELLSRAPVVPWDDDLAMWDKKEMAFNTSGLEFSHRFLGVGDGSNMVSEATLERMKMRTRIYEPELPEEIKACRFPMSNGRLCMRRDLVRCPYHGVVVPRDEFGQIQAPTEQGGFIQEERMLNEEEEQDLMRRAIAAASSTSSASASSSRLYKDKSTWEDIEDDVHQALGLEKIEPKRKRGQKGGSAKKKQKPLSALVNITKPADSSRTRLLRHVTSKSTKDLVEQDRQQEKSSKVSDSRLNRW